MPKELAAVVAELGNANAELVDAVRAGDRARVREFALRVASLEQQRNRLVHGFASPGNHDVDRYDPVPARDRVIQSLQITGRPTGTKLIGDLARAAFGATVNTPTLASLRRDEQRSYRSAHDPGSRVAPRDIYVVPALTADRFTTVRATLALSNWPLPIRLITPSSPRVDFLHTVGSLADLMLRDRATDHAAAEQLLRRLSASVTGAASFWSATPSPADIRDAADAELARLNDRDRDEREQAADRAHTQLDDEQQLFGAVPFGSARAHPTTRRSAR